MNAAVDLPVVIASVYNEFHAFGNLVENVDTPNVQRKRFSIAFPSGHPQDKPRGWDWQYFRIVLERYSRASRPPFATFFAEWSCESCGRWSGDFEPWMFRLTLFAGETGLRDFELGKALVSKGVTHGTFQGLVPAPGNRTDFPLRFFRLVDHVRLFGGGNQERC